MVTESQEEQQRGRKEQHLQQQYGVGFSKKVSWSVEE
jgi:hypothetical protein